MVPVRKIIGLALVLCCVVLTACSWQTDVASNVTDNSATLNGHGSCDKPNVCDVHAEWRAVGSSTWTQGPNHHYDASQANQNVSGSENVKGLLADTTYEYRLVGRQGSKNPEVVMDSQGVVTNGRAPVYSTLRTKPKPTPPTALWTADADTPGSWDVSASNAGPEWASTTERSDRPGMVTRECGTANVRQGNCVYRFETFPGDGGPFDAGRNVVRAELGQGNPGRAGFEDRQDPYGSDRYYGMYIKRSLFPTPTSSSGQQAGMQIKANAPSGAPLIETHLWEGRSSLQVSINNWHTTPDASGDFSRALALGNHVESVGQWYRWVIHVKYADYPNGVIEAWFGPDDGSPLVKMVDDHSAETSMSDHRNNHMRIGIYGGDDGRSHRLVFIDGFRAGTSYASVAPA
jgi:hypothetical protein